YFDNTGSVATEGQARSSTLPARRIDGLLVNSGDYMWLNQAGQPTVVAGRTQFSLTFSFRSTAAPSGTYDRKFVGCNGAYMLGPNSGNGGKIRFAVATTADPAPQWGNAAWSTTPAPQLYDGRWHTITATYQNRSLKL